MLLVEVDQVVGAPAQRALGRDLAQDEPPVLRGDLEEITFADAERAPELDAEPPPARVDRCVRVVPIAITRRLSQGETRNCERFGPSYRRGRLDFTSTQRGNWVIAGCDRVNSAYANAVPTPRAGTREPASALMRRRLLGREQPRSARYDSNRAANTVASAIRRKRVSSSSPGVPGPGCRGVRAPACDADSAAVIGSAKSSTTAGLAERRELVVRPVDQDHLGELLARAGRRRRAAPGRRPTAPRAAPPRPPALASPQRRLHQRVPPDAVRAPGENGRSHPSGSARGTSIGPANGTNRGYRLRHDREAVGDREHHDVDAVVGGDLVVERLDRRVLSSSASAFTRAVPQHVVDEDHTVRPHRGSSAS